MNDVRLSSATPGSSWLLRQKALLRKSWREAWVMLLALMILMLGFHWLYCWIVSLVDVAKAKAMIDLIPQKFKEMLPVSVVTLASYSGRLALSYDHPVVVFGGALWAIARGSDAVSGPLGRGSLEMTLAQPVSRLAVLAAHVTVTVVGTTLIAVSGWLGIYYGVKFVEVMREVDPRPFMWAALNWWCVAFFVSALATMISAGDRARHRTIGLTIALYVVAMLIKVISLSVKDLAWLKYASFLSSHEPQPLVAAAADPARTDAAWLSWQYNAPMIGLGLLAYVAAAVIFSRRDLPAPL